MSCNDPMKDWEILEADALELLAGIEPESVDAIVTDPPYGLGFMGKEWDSPGGCGDFPMRRSDPINTVNTGVSRQGGRQRSCEDFAKRQARDARSAQEWHFAWATLAIRVLKPGAHLVAFGGTRTYHRLACALEDAGFEIRDSLMWIYGNGFPKSLDVSKAIDRAAGAERQVVGKHPDPRHNYPNTDITGGHYIGGKPASRESGIVTAPATDAARQWQGWGTALKPAHEPIVLARKPLAGTVARNVSEYGTGALNVDGCRVESVGGKPRDGEASQERRYTDSGSTNLAALPGPRGGDPAGRWPPNLLLSHGACCGDECGPCCPVRELDRQGGGQYGFSLCGNAIEEATSFSVGERGAAGGFVTSQRASQSGKAQMGLFLRDSSSTTETESRTTTGCLTSKPSKGPIIRESTAPDTDAEMVSGRSSAVSAEGGSRSVDSIEGVGAAGNIAVNPAPIDRCEIGNGPSRFFPRFRYEAKASSGERNAGMGGADKVLARSNQAKGREPIEAGAGAFNEARRVANHHPTVKPIALMRWLCRLVTPPGGLVLDPFLGSGTTMIAALREGFRCIGIERDAEYVAIARRRVEEDMPLFRRARIAPLEEHSDV